MTLYLKIWKFFIACNLYETRVNFDGIVYLCLQIELSKYQFQWQWGQTKERKIMGYGSSIRWRWSA